MITPDHAVVREALNTLGNLQPMRGASTLHIHAPACATRPASWMFWEREKNGQMVVESLPPAASLLVRFESYDVGLTGHVVGLTMLQPRRGEAVDLEVMESLASTPVLMTRNSRTPWSATPNLQHDCTLEAIHLCITADKPPTWRFKINRTDFEIPCAALIIPHLIPDIPA